MQLTIVGPGAWQPLVAEALAGLEDGAARLAEALLRLCHGRHLGLTPTAAAMAATILTETRPAGPAGADQLRPALSRLVDPSDSAAGARPLRFGDAFEAAQTGLMPALVAALAALDHTVLFGGAGHPEPAGFAAAYRGHARRLEAQLVAEAQRLGPLELRARRLGALRRRRLIERAPRRAGGVAALDLETLALVGAAAALLPADDRPPGQRFAPRRLTGPRGGERPAQDGVVGLRISRRLSDLGDIAAGELAHDRLVLVDRMLNSGYFVRHRPPRVHPRRQVLLIGLCLAPPERPAARLAKAAFLASTRRLARQLERGGLAGSDLVWLEADGLGGFRAAGHALDDDAGEEGLDGWLAEALDRSFLGRIEPLPGLGAPPAPGTALRHALGAALARPRRSTEGEERAAGPGAYQTLAAQALLPADGDGEPLAVLRGFLGGEARLQAVGLPDDPALGIAWTLGGGTGRPLLQGLADGPASPAAVARALMSHWIRLVEETLDGRAQALPA